MAALGGTLPDFFEFNIVTCLFLVPLRLSRPCSRLLLFFHFFLHPGLHLPETFFDFTGGHDHGNNEAEHKYEGQVQQESVKKIFHGAKVLPRLTPDRTRTRRPFFFNKTAISPRIWSEWPVYLTFATEKDERRERCRSLLLLSPMSNEPQLPLIEKLVLDLIGPEADLFLVEIRIKPTHNVKVYIDGDQGVSIERLVQFNRRLYKQIEEAGLFPTGEFSLELSSPGLDEPLKMHRQYRKNIGRYAEVTDLEGKKTEGKLVSVSETELVLEEVKGKGKKQETVTHTLPFSTIKTTKIQIKF